jgi:alkylhydroperoxidase family enzyme
MLPFLTNAVIDAMAKRLNSDLTYLKALHAASPRAFKKFLGAVRLGRHREAVPVAPSYAAKLAGVIFEDCGPCVQIVVDQASAAGVADAVIAAVLTGDMARMPDDVRTAHRFAQAVLERSPDLDEARQAVRERWGDKGVVDLTMATQINRLYPMVKLGLGFAQSCRRVSVGAMQIEPARAAR